MNNASLSEFLTSGCLIKLNEDEFLIGWGKRHWIEKPLNHTNCFYFPDFFLQKTQSWFYHENSQLLSHAQLQKFIKNPNLISLKFDWYNPFKGYFFDQFSQLKKLFQNQTLKKAVPYVFELADHSINKNELHQLLDNIIHYTINKPLHVYGFWGVSGGLLGASPEILFDYTKDEMETLKTIACAGTLNNECEEENFLLDSKEALEHQIVVDDICERLLPYGIVSKEKRSILKLPRLSHLVTPISLKIEKHFNYQEIVRALHPTPALGAFPRDQGLDYLKQYDKPLNRNHFGAPVGCLYDHGKKAKSVVAIRNIQWDCTNIRIGAGCGVIEESVAINEWNEINLKIASIKDMLK